MDNRGGGGGRTPRGKKTRGSRGRGQGQDSPSRTPTAATPPVQQSPSVSSTLASTPSISTPLARDDGEKVTPKQTPLKSSVSTPTAEVPPPPKETFQVKLKAAMDPEKETDEVKKPVEKLVPAKPAERMKKEDLEKSVDEEQVSSTVPNLGEQKKVSSSVPNPDKEEKKKDVEKIETPVEKSVSEEPKTPLEKLEPPQLPPPPPIKESTESRVEDALGKAHPRPTAKTLVVTTPEHPARVTDAPDTIQIEPSSLGGATPVHVEGEQGTRPSSSASHGRTGGTTSPAFAYGLRAPVGKPGYIGGVGFSDEESETHGEGRKISPRARRASAIAAVETAVRGFTKRQWVMLTIFGLVDFLSAVAIALQAPFFPAEAERKGATPTEYGFVFGIFEFVVFLISPFFGKYMNKLGPKVVFNVGIIVASLAAISFGLLERVEDHTTFITLCFVCRIFEALGCAGFFTATFTIIAMEFPESVATTFASLETFFGLGMIVGPTLGAVLYDVGGFTLPFVVVGGALLFSGFLSSFVMPKMDKATDDDGKEQVGYGIWTILKIPSVFLGAISIAATSMSLGFISAILEPHLRQFALTPIQTGLVFIINGGIYALTAPIWGYICDYMSKPIVISMLGNIFIFTAFLFIGPASFMPFNTILWVTIIGLVIQGFGFGCCLVAGFVVGLRDSMAHGLPDNMATYGVTSGLWTSVVSLGAWVGPSAAGVLYDQVGFRDASWLPLISAAVVGITIMVHLIFSSRFPKSDSETEPLLRNISPLLGRKDIEADPKPSSSYGSTSGGGTSGGDVLA